MAGPATVTGTASLGDLLAGARTCLDARPDLLVGDSLAQANDHGPAMSEMKVNFKRYSGDQ
jgi:hypothetical protein